MLKIWGIADDNTCRFCGEEEEDIMHLFWYCPDVALFWYHLSIWLSEQGLVLSLSPMHIMWGFQEEQICI